MVHIIGHVPQVQGVLGSDKCATRLDSTKQWDGLGLSLLALKCWIWTIELLYQSTYGWNIDFAKWCPRPIELALSYKLGHGCISSLMSELGFKMWTIWISKAFDLGTIAWNMFLHLPILRYSYHTSPHIFSSIWIHNLIYGFQDPCWFYRKFGHLQS